MKTGWCFAIVNNRLAEIFFEKRNIKGHCYVKKEEYKTKQEQKWIKEDTEKYRFSYRKGKYKKNRPRKRRNIYRGYSLSKQDI